MGLFRRRKTAAPGQTELNGNITDGKQDGSESSKKGSKKSSFGNASSNMDSSNDLDLMQALASHTAEIPKIDLPPAPNPNTDPAKYLRSISSVRERSNLILRRAQDNQLNHFDVDLSKLDQTVKWVTGIIKVCLGIPA
jgi:hypothetical protein